MLVCDSAQADEKGKRREEERAYIVPVEEFLSFLNF